MPMPLPPNTIDTIGAFVDALWDWCSGGFGRSPNSNSNPFQRKTKMMVNSNPIGIERANALWKALIFYAEVAEARGGSGDDSDEVDSAIAKDFRKAESELITVFEAITGWTPVRQDLRRDGKGNPLSQLGIVQATSEGVFYWNLVRKGGV